MLERERNLYIFNFFVFSVILFFLLQKFYNQLSNSPSKVTILFLVSCMIICILKIYQLYFEIINKKNEVFKNIFYNSNDAMAIINRQGNYIWQNKTNSDLLGYSMEDLNTLDTIFYVNKVKISIKKELDKLGKLSGIYTVIDSDSRAKEMWVSAFAIKDELGDIIWYAEVKKDINEFFNVYKQLEQDKNRYEKQAYFDFLTGILNRNGFYQHIQKSEITEGVIIFADIDKFKSINDAFGHDAGDIVLKEVGTLLKNNINIESGLVARWGGEEFILYINMSINEAISFAESLRIKIESLIPNGLTVTCSFGLSQICNKNIDLTISNADKALYCSKNSGRNRVSVFREER